MSTRHIAFTVGAIGAATLAAAFVPMAAAHADDGDAGYFGFTVPDSDSFTQDAGFPPLFEQASADGVSLGYDSSADQSGVFSNADFSADGGSGTVDADVDNLFSPLLGMSSQTITLGDDLTTDGVGADGGDMVAGEGSVFNVTDFGLGFGNVYADAVGAGDDGSNAITDALVTPLGTLDISDLVDVDAAEAGVGDAADINPGADLTGGIDLFGDDGLFDGLFDDVGGILLGGLAGGLLGGGDLSSILVGALIGGVLDGDDSALLSGLLAGLLGGDGLGDILGGLLGGGDGGLLDGLLGGGDGGLGDLLGGLF